MIQEVKEKKDNQGMLDRKETQECQDHSKETEYRVKKQRMHLLAKCLRVDDFRIENKVTNIIIMKGMMPKN